MSTAAPPVSKQFLRIREQAAYLGVHPKTIGRLAARDQSFPAEFQLSEGVRVRSLSELEAWVRSKRPPKAAPEATP